MADLLVIREKVSGFNYLLNCVVLNGFFIALATCIYRRDASQRSASRIISRRALIAALAARRSDLAAAE